MAREMYSVRPKLRVVLTAGLALVLMAACGGGGDSEHPKAKIIEGTEKTAITVTPDQPFVIVLESNPSTGFTWTRDDKLGDSVAFVSTKTVAPVGDDVGAPGKQKFRYRAEEDGDATIKLTYANPAEPSAPGTQTVEYNVTVK